MFPIKETLIGGLGGLAWGFSFWLKTHRDSDGKLEEFEFSKLVRQGLFSMVAGAIIGSRGDVFNLEEMQLVVQGLSSGAFGLLLDNLIKIIWRRFGKNIAEFLGFLG